MLCVKHKRWPYYVMKGNDHGPIYDYYNLKDESMFLQKVVRIKILPKGNLFSMNVADWEFVVNDRHTAPSWFMAEEDLWHTRCINTFIDKIIPAWKKDGITGFLDLSNTELKELPNGLKIKAGYLNLMNTKLTKLPKGLEVEGDLRITNTLISEIPKDIKVKGAIHR